MKVLVVQCQRLKWWRWRDLNPGALPSESEAISSVMRVDCLGVVWSTDRSIVDVLSVPDRNDENEQNLVLYLA